MLRILTAYCVNDCRLVRGSKCFSKVKRRLVCAVELFKFYWNFINRPLAKLFSIVVADAAY